MPKGIYDRSQARRRKPGPKPGSKRRQRMAEAAAQHMNGSNREEEAVRSAVGIGMSISNTVSQLKPFLDLLTALGQEQRLNFAVLSVKTLLESAQLASVAGDRDFASALFRSALDKFGLIRRESSIQQPTAEVTNLVPENSAPETAPAPLFIFPPAQ